MKRSVARGRHGRKLVEALAFSLKRPKSILVPYNEDAKAFEQVAPPGILFSDLYFRATRVSSRRRIASPAAVA